MHTFPVSFGVLAPPAASTRDESSRPSFFIDYTDFTFPEDEHQQNHDSLDEDSSVQNFQHNTDEDEDEVSDHETDIYKYTSFFTDHERYQFDQARWNGIPNSRKHTIAKKEEKVESVSDFNFAKQSKLEARPKASREGRSKKQEPVDDAVKTAREGEIHFDNKGAIWYSHKRKREILILMVKGMCGMLKRTIYLQLQTTGPTPLRAKESAC